MHDIFNGLILAAFAAISVILPVVVWLRYRTGIALWLAAAISLVYLAGINAIAGSPHWVLDILRGTSAICAGVYLVLVARSEIRERREVV